MKGNLQLIDIPKNNSKIIFAKNEEEFNNYEEKNTKIEEENLASVIAIKLIYNK